MRAIPPGRPPHSAGNAAARRTSTRIKTVQKLATRGISDTAIRHSRTTQHRVTGRPWSRGELDQQALSFRAVPPPGAWLTQPGIGRQAPSLPSRTALTPECRCRRSHGPSTLHHPQVRQAVPAKNKLQGIPVRQGIPRRTAGMGDTRSGAPLPSHPARTLSKAAPQGFFPSGGCPADWNAPELPHNPSMNAGSAEPEEPRPPLPSKCTSRPHRNRRDHSRHSGTACRKPSTSPAAPRHREGPAHSQGPLQTPCRISMPAIPTASARRRAAACQQW